MSDPQIRKATRQNRYEVKNGRNSFAPVHGMSESTFYKKWKSMKHRCEPTWKKRKDYFDRGIKVCERWQVFENFLADMWPTYAEGLEIDRKNNDGDYEPGNCRWVTRAENQSNRRCSKWIVINGEKKSAKEAAEILGVHYQTLIYRLRAGWKPEAVASSAYTFHAERNRNHLEAR